MIPWLNHGTTTELEMSMGTTISISFMDTTKELA